MTNPCKEVSNKDIIMFFREPGDDNNFYLSDDPDVFCITLKNGDKYKLSIDEIYSNKIKFLLTYLGEGRVVGYEFVENICFDMGMIFGGVGFEIGHESFSILLMMDNYRHDNIAMNCFKKIQIKKNLKKVAVMGVEFGLLNDIPLHRAIFIQKDDNKQNIRCINLLKENIFDCNIRPDYYSKDVCNGDVFNDDVTTRDCEVNYVSGSGGFVKYIYRNGYEVGFGCVGNKDYRKINLQDIAYNSLCTKKKNLDIINSISIHSTRSDDSIDFLRSKTKSISANSIDGYCTPVVGFNELLIGVVYASTYFFSALMKLRNSVAKRIGSLEKILAIKDDKFDNKKLNKLSQEIAYSENENFNNDQLPLEEQADDVLYGIEESRKDKVVESDNVQFVNFRASDIGFFKENSIEENLRKLSSQSILCGCDESESKKDCDDVFYDAMTDSDINESIVVKDIANTSSECIVNHQSLFSCK